LSAFFVEAIWGEVPSPNIWIFAAGYGYYQLYPIILLARFWKDDPFSQSAVGKKKIHPAKPE